MVASFTVGTWSHNRWGVKLRVRSIFADILKPKSMINNWMIEMKITLIQDSLTFCSSKHKVFISMR